MTEDEYWNKDPRLLEAFYKTYMEELHREAHIYGYYNFVALTTALSNAFRDKGKKPIPYMEKPIEVFKEKLTKEKAQMEYRKAVNYQNNWLNALSANK